MTGPGIRFCIFAAVALSFAAWEIMSRHRGHRWPIRLLATAGVGWLFAGLWLMATRGSDPSWTFLAHLAAIFAVVPYVLLRAEDQMRGDP